MRRFLLYSAFILAGGLFASCGDDDSKSGGGPQPTYDVNIKATSTIGVYYTEVMDGLSNYYMTLADVKVEGDAENPTFGGAGNAVCLDMYILQEEEGVLPAGTYTYIADEDADFVSLSFSNYSLYLTTDSTGEVVDGNEFTEAKLNISKKGNTYTIDLTATLDDGRSLHASYTGALTFANGGGGINGDDFFPPMDQNTQTTFTEQSAIYYGPKKEGLGEFAIYLYDRPIDEYFTPGNALIIKLYSPVSGDEKTPATGTYTVASNTDPSTYNAYQLQPGYIDMQTLQNKGTNLTQTRQKNEEELYDLYGMATSGSVTVDIAGNTYTISVDLKDKNGYKIEGTYSGELNIKDRSFHSTLADDLVANVADIPCEIDYYGQFFADKGITEDDWGIYIESDQDGTEKLQIEVLAPHGDFAGKLPVGEYIVTNEYTPGSYICLPAEYNEGMLYCSWWMGNMQGGVAYEIAPFISGKVLVSKSGDTYTISLDVYDDAPVPNHITGSWSGVPKFFNKAAKSSSARRMAKATDVEKKAEYRRIPFTSDLRRRK